MKNKIMTLMCCQLMAISTLSFADNQPVTVPVVTAAQKAKEKATFNQNQDIYNDQANKAIRAKELADKKLMKNEQNKKNVQNEKDEKNGLDQKDGADAKNEQYDKQLSVKF